MEHNVAIFLGIHRKKSFVSEYPNGITVEN